MDKFLTMEKTLSGFPPESSEYTANYTMGYAYLKKKDYANAQTSFNTCVTSIKKEPGIHQKQLYHRPGTG
jgi:TolA-binding protein